MVSTVDVLIVGAGPVGLFMAHELSRYGLQVRLIDKNPGASDKSKALALHVRTMEILAQVNMLEPALQQGEKMKAMSMYANDKRIVHLTFDRLNVSYPFVLTLPQYNTETIITKYLQQRFNIRPEWNTELLNFAQNENGVTATISQAGQEQEVQAKWLIGCDGAHSRTRHVLNESFAGAAYAEHFWLGDVDVDWKQPYDELALFLQENGFMAVFPFEGKRCRVIFEVRADAKKEPTLADLQNLINERGLKNITLSNPHWLTIFSVSHRQVNNYRHGRVFLAGDAAHIHSPAGGQGLNTGLQDAYNLAWKLAYVMQNKASDKLLDSYQIERHAVGAMVLKETDKLTQMVTMKGKLKQNIRNCIMSLVTSIPFINNKITAHVSEIDINYRHSPLSKQSGQTSIKAGDRCPDIDNLFEQIHGEKVHLLQFYTNANAKQQDALAENIERQFIDIFFHRLDNKQTAKVFGLNNGGVCLLRPDGYVGYIASHIYEAELLIYLKEQLYLKAR